MFQDKPNRANLYSEVSISTGVNSADPHRLIEMLFERADELLSAADSAISCGDRPGKGEAITRVIRIVDEGLRASLNYDAGELAQNLGSLYDYMLQRLLQANQNNCQETLAEVRRLMHELHSAWSAIGPLAAGKRSRGSVA